MSERVKNVQNSGTHCHLNDQVTQFSARYGYYSVLQYGVYELLKLIYMTIKISKKFWHEKILT